jgi:Domain of unknown function (DUF4386)
MKPTRRNSTATAALLIVATAAALAAAQLVAPVLTGGDYLADLATHPKQVAGGALLYLVAAAGSAGIAISLYPVLKKTNPAVALGSVVFRAIEAVLYVVAVVCLLSVMTLSTQGSTGHATDRASIQAVSDALLSMRQHATLAAVFAFSLGAAMYYVLFYQSRLVPRWLSGWGIGAAIVIMTACLLALFSDSSITGYTLLVLPIAVQEIVLAVWLLAKGFSPSALRRTASSGDSTKASDEPAAALLAGHRRIDRRRRLRA